MFSPSLHRSQPLFLNPSHVSNTIIFSSSRLDLSFRSCLTLLLYFLFISPRPHGIMFPIYGRAPAPPQDYRCCAGAYPTPVCHIWRAHSEDRETQGIEPGTSWSPDERSTNWANRPISPRFSLLRWRRWNKPSASYKKPSTQWSLQPAPSLRVTPPTSPSPVTPVTLVTPVTPPVVQSSLPETAPQTGRGLSTTIWSCYRGTHRRLCGPKMRCSSSFCSWRHCKRTWRKGQSCCIWRMTLWWICMMIEVVWCQGRTQATGGGGEGPDPPWDLKNTTLSGFLPEKYAICFFEVCFL